MQWSRFACLLLASFLTLTLSSTEVESSNDNSGNSFHRIAFGSCFNPNRGDSMFSLIAGLRPQQFLSLGDIIYADFHPKYNYKQYANPTIIREEYEKVFRKSAVITNFVQSLSHGWLMTYDDHDYGRNNGDKTFQYRQEAIDLFHEYAPRAVGRHVVVRREQLQRLLQYLRANGPRQEGQSSPVVEAVLTLDEPTKKELIHKFFMQKKGVDLEVGLEVAQLSSSELLRALNLTKHSGVSLLTEDEVAINKGGVYSSEVFSVPVPNGGIAPSESFNYKVILLDGRSSKDSTGTPFGDFLGLDQWLWLEDELNPLNSANQNIDLFLVGSAIQVLPDDKLVEECWDEFPHQRQLLLARISELSLYSNVLLLTGDIHSAEIAQASCKVLRADRRTGSISNDTVPIIEATSSGLSHTFTKVTGKQQQKKDKKKQADIDPELKTDLVNQRSRGFFVEFLSSLYQISYPGHFRERKHVDAFQGLHVATLDLEALHAGSANSKGGRINVHIRIVNHEGNPVIEKSWPLQEKSFQTAHDEAVEVVECLPFWNAVPWYKVLLFRASMVTFGMIFVLFPVLVLLWLLGAAIYYLCIGGELLRRDRIEKRYQKRHQLFVGKGNKQL